MLVVTLRVGQLRQVIPDSLAFYFEIVSRDTLVEGARLEQVVVPVRMRCEDCARRVGARAAVPLPGVRRRG